MKPPVHFVVREHGTPNFSSPAVIQAFADWVIASVNHQQDRHRPATCQAALPTEQAMTPVASGCDIRHIVEA